ncbi:hypothetical protein [Shewanella surugensis]|uniref:Uncharacterized protein n=1 Tax=Shewanella surugensis TaxID=212020 RepID=A0ABT0LB87_9GAMM|nr:hypothetical protein [Shewanella surugensis]MCL1124961.1 hypothetical protein [Shewanella surugensis]
MDWQLNQMWMVFGALAMMLLLINAPRNILTLLVLMILSTLVVDEESLLEVAASIQGEPLTNIRDSRQFEAPTLTSVNEVEAKLTDKLNNLLKSRMDSDEVVQALEAYRIELQVKVDLAGLDEVDKAVMQAFSSHGTLTEETFFIIMKNQGYTDDRAITSYKKLATADYIASSPTDFKQAQLTKQGMALMKALKAY